MPADQSQDLGPRIPLSLLSADHAEVRAKEGTLVSLGLPHPQLSNDVGGDPARGRRGEREDGQSVPSRALVANLVPQSLKRPVGRAEVVSPLRNAVCLIDDDQGERRVAQAFPHVWAQRFGRQVDEFVVPSLESPQSSPTLVRRERRVDRRGAEPDVAERVDLVLHQADERGEDEHGPGHDAGRDLEGERLPRSGGHNAYAVPPRQDRVDDVGLSRPELVVTEDVAQDGFRVVGSGVAHLGEHTTDIRRGLNVTSTA